MTFQTIIVLVGKIWPLNFLCKSIFLDLFRNLKLFLRLNMGFSKSHNNMALGFRFNLLQ